MLELLTHEFIYIVFYRRNRKNKLNWTEKFTIILCMLHLLGTEKYQLISRNIYLNAIFDDDHKLSYIKNSNFQQKIFKGSRFDCPRARVTDSTFRVTNYKNMFTLSRTRYCWSFMEQTRSFGCVSSANSDRTMQGVITHDCMVNEKYAEIVFSELFEDNPLAHLPSTSN